MAEIKSTLDLVMEKTRHLSLSEEEKTEQQYHEIHKIVMGIIQKYQDGILNAVQVKAEFDALQKTYNANAEKIMKDGIIDRLNLDLKNDSLSVLLKEIFRINITGIVSVINEYQNAVSEASLNRTDAIKTTLLEKHFISGSAVVPNLEVNDQWATELKTIRKKYNQILEQEKTGMKGL